jgi:long-chain fatty acid transport protein
MLKLKLLTAGAVMLATTSALATNGYFAHGYSTKEKGLAGAGVAYSQDALASATNPAGLVNVGNRFDAGIALFSPQREYQVNGMPSGYPGTMPLSPGNYSSDNNAFAIPNIGASWMLNDTNAVGIAAYGGGGMNTEYNGVQNAPGYPTGTFYGGTAGVDLMQLFVNATYATKIAKQHSLGISVIGVAQSFEAKGLNAFGGPLPIAPNGISSNPAALSDNGKDRSYGVGAKIGWQGEVTDSFTIGASYQSEVNMSAFDSYAGLFANGGDFDIPASATVGIAVNTSPTTVLVLDVQRIYYSNVDSIANPMMNVMLPDGSGALGGVNGAGFGWEDMTVVKVGYEFGSSNRYRVGASYGEQPIPDSEVMFNILAPAVMQTHLTAGATFPFGEASEFNVAGMYAPSYTVSGANPLDPNQTIDLTMEQYEVQVGYGLNF